LSGDEQVPPRKKGKASKPGPIEPEEEEEEEEAGEEEEDGDEDGPDE
jgi:hypothetical protein